ncbi:hypothetical protein GUJ93_ZPchr0005g14409 [Zizania palustris]|uniref:Uncharacterized protein n=1 Tax=Zizania palustris TaxID=103762 RepID=A0A8J5SQS7_ZIZPA|nr:hypothetical protein GUJ93_ZPchr0005g14409 [Zizania palustris]
MNAGSGSSPPPPPPPPLSCLEITPAFPIRKRGASEGKRFMAAAAAAGDASEGEQQLLLHLKLAFLALEPPACVLALARKAGGGSVTPHVQNFILESCTGAHVGGYQNCTYVTTILKKIITEAELSSDIVIDGLYEEFGQFVSSKPNNSLLNRTDMIYKEISFFLLRMTKS